jgi:hypothetical protein
MSHNFIYFPQNIFTSFDYLPTKLKSHVYNYHFFLNLKGFVISYVYLVCKYWKCIKRQFLSLQKLPEVNSDEGFRSGYVKLHISDLGFSVVGSFLSTHSTSKKVSLSCAVFSSAL